MSITARRPGELVEILRADYQARYEPNFAWKSAVSAHLALPGLRAFWPMSAVDYTNPQCLDVAGGGYHLTNNNTATFGYGPNRVLAPCVFLDGASQYLSRADGGAGNWADITGTESYIESTAASEQGLTFGMWVRPRGVSTGTNQHYIGKWSVTAADRAYRIIQTAAGAYYGQAVGAGPTQVAVTGATAVLNTWAHVVEVFLPNALYLYVDGVQYSNLAGIPASVQDTTASFTIGDRSTTGEPANCLGSLAFLAATAFSQSTVVALFEQTRAMFGV